MDIWVRDLKTGEKWKLDDDKNKIVHRENGHTQFKLCDISRFRFFPCDPDHTEEFKAERCKELEKNARGYQYSIFDYEV